MTIYNMNTISRNIVTHIFGYLTICQMNRVTQTCKLFLLSKREPMSYDFTSEEIENQTINNPDFKTKWENDPILAMHYICRPVHEKCSMTNQCYIDTCVSFMDVWRGALCIKEVSQTIEMIEWGVKNGCPLKSHETFRCSRILDTNIDVIKWCLDNDEIISDEYEAENFLRLTIDNALGKGKLDVFEWAINEYDTRITPINIKKYLIYATQAEYKGHLNIAKFCCEKVIQNVDIIGHIK